MLINELDTASMPIAPQHTESLAPLTYEEQAPLREVLLEARLFNAKTRPVAGSRSSELLTAHYQLFMAAMAYFCPNKEHPLPPMSQAMLATLSLMRDALHDPLADHGSNCIIATELLRQTEAIHNEAVMAAMESAMSILDGRRA